MPEVRCYKDKYSWRGFVADTTLHGLSKPLTSEFSTARRCIWAAILIVLAVFFSLLFADHIRKFTR